MKNLKEEYEKQIDLLRDQHEISLKRLSSEIDKLNSEKYVLLAELDTNRNPQAHNANYYNSHKSNISSMNGDAASSLSGGTLNSALTQNPINDEPVKKMRATGMYDHSYLHTNYRMDDYSHAKSDVFLNHDNQQAYNSETNIYNDVHYRHLANLPASKKTNFIDSDNSPTNAIRLSLGTQFRLDEQKRKKELENLLDSHIDALKKSTANVDMFLKGHNLNNSNQNVNNNFIKV